MTLTESSARLSPAGEDAAALVSRLRSTFDSGRTRPLEWRRAQLVGLLRLLHEHEDELLTALHADIGKPSAEGWMTDLAFTSSEICDYAKHLERWAAPQRVSVPLRLRPGRADSVREPLGVTLVIAPWNYPVQLLLVPIAGAIAAGNTVIGKPSEMAPHTSATIARLIPRYLDPDAVAIVEGAVDETTSLLEQRFDHIFYTGNGRVGRIVMAAAARHLTPVTLELGGKSPTVVDRTANIDVAARRIAWGKFLNAGQTCIAPDYVLVHTAVHDELIEKLGTAVRSFYGDDPQRSSDYARIVNDTHYGRLTGLLDAGGYASLAFGGEHDRADRYISPTLMTGVADDAAVMRDEIFGPLLPVIPVDDADAAIARINGSDKPLALYVFGAESVTSRVIERTSSGGVGVNNTLFHITVPTLPFGGVGESGMGSYHGRRSFDTFSHVKPVFRRPPTPDPSVGYPPYNRLKRFVIKRMLG